jgi:hypothetical protein
MNATATTVKKDNLTQFINLVKPESIVVIACDGLLMAASEKRKHCIGIGDHSGEPAMFEIDQSRFAKYVRSLKAGDDLAFSVTGKPGEHSLVMDSERAGEVAIDQSTKGRKLEPVDPFGDLGEYKFTIALEQVMAAASIIDRADADNSRYALGCVMFDGDKIICCDGRRLACLDSTVEVPEATMVNHEAIKYAVKFKFDIDVFANGFIAGDLVLTKLEGRYPTWQQVIPKEKDVATKVSMATAELRKLADNAITKAKATGEGSVGVSIRTEVPLGNNVTALLNARFILDAIGKLNTVEIAYPEEYADCAEAKILTRPAVFTSSERPGWMEVIMPMAKDR